MDHKKAQMNPSHRVLGGAIANRKMAACIGIALSLAACGLSKPGASDIEPYVMDRLGQCQLWTVSDVRKADGIEEGEAYRVDFTAKLTLKETPEQTMATYRQHQMDPNYAACHQYVSYLVIPVEGPVSSAEESISFAKQYEIAGAGMLVKSEKGWRLRGNLQSSFNPI